MINVSLRLTAITQLTGAWDNVLVWCVGGPPPP